MSLRATSLNRSSRFAERDLQQRLPDPHLKSVPISTKRSGWPRVHRLGSKMRARNRRDGRVVLAINGLGQRAANVGERSLDLAGSAKARPARPHSVAMTSAVPNGEG